MVGAPLDPPGLTTGSAEGASPRAPASAPAATPSACSRAALHVSVLSRRRPRGCTFLLSAATETGSLHPRRPAKKKDSEITEQRRSGMARILKFSAGILEADRSTLPKASTPGKQRRSRRGRLLPGRRRLRRSWPPSGIPTFSGEASCPGFLPSPSPARVGARAWASRRGSRGPRSRRRGKQASRAREPPAAGGPSRGACGAHPCRPRPERPPPRLRRGAGPRAKSLPLGRAAGRPPGQRGSASSESRQNPRAARLEHLPEHRSLRAGRANPSKPRAEPLVRLGPPHLELGKRRRSSSGVSPGEGPARGWAAPAELTAAAPRPAALTVQPRRSRHRECRLQARLS